MPTARPPKPVSQWSDPRHRRGYAGERAAMAYLLGQGWRIEAHRFRLGHHDLDLIARRGDLVAFVEVKARRSRRFGLAAEAVGPRKRAVLLRLAELWRVRFGRPSDRYRFDLIAVEDGAAGGVAGSTTPHLTHIEGAWAGVER
ncbi:MAG TPA: YraN family protein [Gemmatimonadales bacterium]|nr:YraN family protein [Gemmatimonadales bacterium]